MIRQSFLFAAHFLQKELQFYFSSQIVPSGHDMHLRLADIFFNWPSRYIRISVSWTVGG